MGAVLWVTLCDMTDITQTVFNDTVNVYERLKLNIMDNLSQWHFSPQSPHPLQRYADALPLTIIMPYTISLHISHRGICSAKSVSLLFHLYNTCVFYFIRNLNEMTFTCTGAFSSVLVVLLSNIIPPNIIPPFPKWGCNLPLLSSRMNLIIIFLINLIDKISTFVKNAHTVSWLCFHLTFRAWSFFLWHFLLKLYTTIQKLGGFSCTK